MIFGSNVITITVTAKNGTSIKNYSVNVYRKNESEETEEQRNLIETNNIDENLENNITNNIINNVSAKKSNVLWIAFVILLIVALVIIIYIIKKKRQ